MDTSVNSSMTNLDAINNVFGGSLKPDIEDATNLHLTMLVEVQRVCSLEGIQSLRQAMLFLRICNYNRPVSICELVGKEVPSTQREYQIIYSSVRQLMLGEYARGYNGAKLIKWESRGVVGLTSAGCELAEKITLITKDSRYV